MEENNNINSEREEFLNKLRHKEAKDLTPEEILKLKDEPLTQKEAFSLVEEDKDKVEQYDLFNTLKEKALNGELTRTRIKILM